MVLRKPSDEILKAILSCATTLLSPVANQANYRGEDGAAFEWGHGVLVGRMRQLSRRQAGSVDDTTAVVLAVACIRFAQFHFLNSQLRFMSLSC